MKPGGAARRRLFAILEKPEGAFKRPPSRARVNGAQPAPGDEVAIFGTEYAIPRGAQIDRTEYVSLLIICVLK